MGVSALDTKRQLVLDYYLGGLLHILAKPFVIALGVLLGRDHDLSRCSTITLLKLKGAGSLAIAYPALLALRQRPSTRLRLVTTPAVHGFAQAMGVFDEIILIDDSSIAGIAAGSVRAILRLFRTDALIDLEVHSRLTTVFSLLTCARNRLGFYTQISFWRKGLSTHLLFCNLSTGVYHFYDQIAALFGCPVAPFETCVSEFRRRVSALSAGEPLSARRGGRWIGLSPCCSGLGRERMLKPLEWANILDRSEPAGCEITLHALGGKSDRSYIDEVFAALRNRRPDIACQNHAGSLTAAESLGLMSRLNEIYCIDSAIIHFARLLGVNTTSFWGPTNPATRLRPSSQSTDRVFYSALPCSPCVHLGYESPCHGQNVCMRKAADATARVANPVWLVQENLAPSLQALSIMVSAERRGPAGRTTESSAGLSKDEAFTPASVRAPE